MDDQIHLFLERQNKNHREIIDTVRKIIFFNFPKIKETGMKEGLWYEGKFYLSSFKDHVNLGVCVVGLTESELRNFEGSGKTMRHLKIFSKEDIHKYDLPELLKLIYTKTSCDKDISWIA